MFLEICVFAVLFLAALWFISYLKLFTTFRPWFAMSIVLAATMGIAFAQDAVALVEDPALPPEWLADVIQWAYAIPKVGPIIVEIGKWLGLIASVFTALSIAVTAILKVPQLLAVWAGADEWALKLEKLNEKVQPYLKWISVFNVQKKK